MFKKLTVGAVIAASFGLVNAAPALADDPSGGDPAPSAQFTGVVVAHDGMASVTFDYTCSSADGPINHLFVAVKQGPRINTTDRSSSRYAQSFYSTNWSADNGPNALTCDGTAQHQTVVLKQDPGWGKHATNPKELKDGAALVQICLFDNATGFGDDGPIGGGFVFDYTMQEVVASK